MTWSEANRIDVTTIAARPQVWRVLNVHDEITVKIAYPDYPDDNKMGFPLRLGLVFIRLGCWIAALGGDR